MAAPPLRHWKILARKDLTPSGDVFELHLEYPQDLSFKAGQYLSVVIPGAGPGGRNLRRAYSISSPPKASTVDLCIKLVENGPGTQYLNSLKAGDEIQGQAPFGDFCLKHDQSAPTMFIGTGTGVAPLRAMILSEEWKPQAPSVLLLGVRTELDIIYPELFPELHSSKLPTVVTLSRLCLSRPIGSPELGGPWKGFQGRVTDFLRKFDWNSLKWNFQDTHYYLCGSGAMLAEIKEYLENEHGVPKEQIHYEKYY